MKIVVVVVGYSKDKSIDRLFQSLKLLVGVEKIDIVVSLDGGSIETVVDISEQFVMDMPNAKLITRDVNLGLKKHMLECFKLGLEYDALILLEDDLIISKDTMAFVNSSLVSFSDIDTVAGFSLYSPEFNETAYLPFKPIQDGSDCFFMQIPSSWGLFLNKEQIRNFLNFVEQEDGVYINLPPNVRRWSDKSWKKIFYKYLVDTKKYFLYPRISLSTNFADPGEHHAGLNTFQVNILHSKTNYEFKEFNESKAIYDGYCEILPEVLKKLNPRLEKYDFEVDLYGFKRLSRIYNPNQLVITLIDCGPSNIVSWDGSLFPPENNIIFNLDGKGVFLTEFSEIGFIKRILIRLILIKKYHNLDFSSSFFSRLLGRN